LLACHPSRLRNPQIRMGGGHWEHAIPP
jgi:hypothetical protein